MNVKSLSLAVAACTIWAVGGAASASATWTWAPSTNQITMIGGRGQGQAMGVIPGTLTSALADTQADGQRVYASLFGSYVRRKARGLETRRIFAESGRRSDGGASLARMADKNFIPLFGDTLAMYNYQVRLCRDKRMSPDPCSDDVRTHKGL